jgi:hypothetical protein
MFGRNRAPILRQDLHYLRTDWIELPLEPHQLGVPSCASKMISVPVVRSAQTMQLSCVKNSAISNELSQASTWASSPRSNIGCVQNHFWAYGMFSTNLHLSCTDTNTISKWTKTRFHMTHVTLEFHWVRPKWFLRLWYVRYKPCTYLTSRLAISLNGLDRGSTWASSARSRDENDTDIFRPYSRPNSFREVLIRLYSSPDI